MTRIFPAGLPLYKAAPARDLSPYCSAAPATTLAHASAPHPQASHTSQPPSRTPQQASGSSSD
eukprot:CAMPEP_0185853906 /NCGR_PEP_ID=MMETSP1354-20130828/20660_1 /TAXON_ID=708628 /ORGANISM="Erythrolobus madagascarensis, Strain CCMP3276" /LENGTH=62 /DNA_ID=CAMNT_0028555533 /DNA_START=1 /DNA_END=189 /DNA_ORIENTATION=+